MIDTSFAVSAVICIALSLWALIHLWKSAESLPFKLYMSVLVLMPVLGPLFYFFIKETPEALPEDEIRTKGRFLYGNYGLNYDVYNKKTREEFKQQNEEITRQKEDIKRQPSDEPAPEQPPPPAEENRSRSKGSFLRRSLAVEDDEKT